MYYQDDSMFGTAPLLMDSTYDYTKLASIAPFNFLPFINLGLILLITFLLNCMTYSTNSGLKSSSYIFSRICRFSSLVSGLIIVQQSLSLKNDFSIFLILFFYSTPSENPFYGYSAFSRYSFEVIGSPSRSTS